MQSPHESWTQQRLVTIPPTTCRRSWVESMAASVLLDNDVILKTCCYDTVRHLSECIAGNSRTLHALGVAKFVLKSVIAKKRHILNRERAASRLAEFLASSTLIEPDEDELLLAAEFEAVAQSSGLNLDVGESQLLAVLIKRSALL